jgi:Secretion system C-terminal sorting domain
MKNPKVVKTILIASACLMAAFYIFKGPLSINTEKEGEENETEMLEAYYQQEFKKTVDPKLGYVPTERLKIAYDQAQRERGLGVRAAVGLGWAERGPSNIGGRTRALLFDKNDATNKKVWAGSVGGGLWSTTDITAASPAWTKVNDFMGNLAITTIAQDQASPLKMYCGTGEGRYNLDAIRGLGIFVSTDGGVSWTQSAATNNANFYYVQKIVVASGGQVYAATLAGLYKSTDFGTSWTRVLGTTTAPASGVNDISDVEIGADGSIYVGTGNYYSTPGQLWKSSFATHGANTGNVGNWTNVSPAGAYRRVEIATAPSNSQVVYAMAHNGANNNCSAIFSSADGGGTWTSNVAPTIYDQGSNSNFTRGQAWYDLIMAVDPNDATKVYIGGVDVLRSSNSGSTWEQITTWSGYNAGSAPAPWPRASLHADIHEIKFVTGSSTTAVIGCDGGVYYSTNINGVLAAGVPSVSSKNSNYNVTQYYAADNNPTACNNDIIAGAQDNGTQVMQSSGISTGATVSGGDGMFCHIDQNNANVQISSYVFNNYYFTNTYWSTAFSSASNNTGQFINPTDFDDANNILYACAGSGAYYDIAGGILTGAGSTLPTNTSHSGLSGLPAAFKVDPNSPNILWVGSDGGSLNKVVNPNSGAPVITLPVAAGFFVGYISSIDVQKGNSNHILVTVSNYGVSNVWESTNGGTAFTALDNNLPDMPVRWGIFNPLNADQILLATELGVWSTDNINGAATLWTADNSGLANVRVDMLKYRESDYTIVAATHGRGVFTAKLSTPVPQTNGNVVAEQQLQTGQNNLGPNSTAYFYSSTDGQLICKIANNTSYNYGCTTVNVTRASNVSLTPIHFYTITNANDLLPKTIQVVPTNILGSGNNCTITMYFTAAEITAWQTHTGATWAQANVVNCSGNITLVTPAAKTAGGTVTILPNTANTTVGLPEVSATFTTPLGSYGIGTSTTFVLPIELLGFTGNLVDKSAVLNWQTANERNAKQFDVERSFDGKNFEKIGTVKAKGNSATAVDYALTDYKPAKGVNYYRLRQVDMDEGAVLSKVVAVAVNTVKQLQVFPNPAHDKLSVVGDNLGNYTISDLSGRDILRGPLNSYESAIDVSTLPSGVYLLNANRSSVKFLKL